jgi:DNA-binding transcriptional regulator YdaS (Cro superfamily)
MRLSAYFDLQRQDGTPESYARFAARAGLKESTVRAIVRGGGASATTALKVIDATHGLVRLEDLTPATAPDDEAA